jgi:putative oxidoreductase
VSETGAYPNLRRALGLLLLRLAIGGVFVMHGAQKMFGAIGGPGLKGAVGAAEMVGFPAFFGYILAATEFFGGLAIILGLGTRIAAALIAFVMGVAIVKVHGSQGFFLKTVDTPGGPVPGGWEFPYVLLLGSLALALTGAGAFAIEAAFSPNLRRRKIGTITGQLPPGPDLS